MTKVYIIVGCEDFHKRGLLRVCTHLSLHAYIQHAHRHAYRSNQKGPEIVCTLQVRTVRFGKSFLCTFRGAGKMTPRLREQMTGG